MNVYQVYLLVAAMSVISSLCTMLVTLSSRVAQLEADNENKNGAAGAHMKGNCGDQSSDTTFGEASSLSASWTRSVVIGRFEYAVMDDCPIFPSAKSPCFSSTQRGNENAIEMPISRKIIYIHF